MAELPAPWRRAHNRQAVTHHVNLPTLSSLGPVGPNDPIDSLSYSVQQLPVDNDVVHTNIDWYRYRAMPSADQQRYLNAITKAHMAQLTAQIAAQHAAQLQQMMQQAMTQGAGGSYTSMYANQMLKIPISTQSATTSGTFISSTGSNTTNTLTMATGGNASGYTSWNRYTDQSDAYEREERYYEGLWRARSWQVKDGTEKKITLPDGTVVEVESNGSYRIVDKDAKVIYRANKVRDFNRFLNVSDRLEEFIAFCGDQMVRKDEFLELPLNLFIKWLVIEAAKADQVDPPADVKLLPDLRRAITPRCTGCGRFLPRYATAKKLFFCAPPCFERHYHRSLPAPDINDSALSQRHAEPARLPRLSGDRHRDQRAAGLQAGG